MDKVIIDKAAKAIAASSHTTAFTGAGISVESGIPPFRGPGGLWNKYNPETLDIDYFKQHPLESWVVIKEIFYDFFSSAKPNGAHMALAQLENMALLSAIITQNIDNLHQAAGSKNVIEYHGNSQKLICPHCNNKFRPHELDLNELPPRCQADNSVLKPDFVFFGESIPGMAHILSTEESQVAEVFLLIGTTGEVMPAAMVPRLAKDRGATIVEVNPEESLYTKDITDIFLQGKATEIMDELLTRVGKMRDY
jgi:NAD-dependent deacetylase